MSERWPGGIVRSTPVTPTGPLQNGTAPGIWTMEQAAYWTKQGLWPTAGNFTAVEDVFSTWLYTGNGSTQTITNGINLSGQGGLVWIKDRNNTGDPKNHYLYDTVRGTSVSLSSNTTSGNLSTSGIQLTAFNNNGFSLGSSSNVNQNTFAHVAWTFREAANFFDVVTYTGNGTNRTISHSLGTAPGTIIIKRTDADAGWAVYHRALGATEYLLLNDTGSSSTSSTTFNNTAPTSTVFSLGTSGLTNFSGATYVAYLFAHDTSSTGLIQCGSFTTDSSGIGSATLGWEPQWVLVKRTNTTGNWFMLDTMRGWNMSNDATLYANLSDAETSADYGNPTATGFTAGLNVNSTYIYIAIRRGPMKTPTLGTSVFSPNAISSGQPAGTKVTTNFPVDLVINTIRSGDSKEVLTRLTASNTSVSSIGLRTNLSDAETNRSPSRGYGWDSNVSLTLGGYYTDFGGSNNIQWNFRRAPSFFDVVCYTGTSVANRQVAHNLGVVPELIIVKSRSAAVNWEVLASNIPRRLNLNTTSAGSTPPPAIVFGDDTNYVAPTSSYFVVGTNGTVNSSANTYVAYLFASCPGVSKVGSYTGNGSSQTINCGFTTGARFVLIKRTDSTGDWFVWDSARGIVAANDPYLALNDTNAEVTTNDSVDTDNSGFIVNQVAASNVNVNAATYIFLAVA